MHTLVVDAGAPSSLDVAERVLRDGGLVAFPTDTVYGVGALISLPRAVERIFVAKGRIREKAIPVLLADVSHLSQVVAEVPELALRLAKAFWPGGLTLVLEKSGSVPPEVTSGGETIAVRVPNHQVALSLIGRVGGAVAATSANRSGAPSPRTAEDVQQQLAGLIELILNAGPTPGGVESTVLDLTHPLPVVLRQGAVSLDALENAIGQRPALPSP